MFNQPSLSLVEHVCCDYYLLYGADGVQCSILWLDGVKEYLHLSENATKMQLARVKALFEKRNQKSTQTIAHLQTKIDNYTRRIHDLETVAVDTQKDAQHRKTVGQGLK